MSKKTSTNLSLTTEARRMGEELQKIMRRPSLTNVVETLIAEKHEQLVEANKLVPALRMAEAATEVVA